MRKIFALFTAAAMLLSLAGCSTNAGSPTVGNMGGDYQDPYGELTNYDEKSEAIYTDALGAFYDAYEEAQEADSVAQRYALLAVAEAKLMESAVMLPLICKGGNYAISRVAPYTHPNVLWGNDEDRLHDLLVTDQPITRSDRDTMKEKWAQLKGTGTYEAWAKQYLSEMGYRLKDSHSLSYNSDPRTWDVLSTSRAADAEAIVNTYDGLYEYDCEGTLQPALAKSYTVTKNADGTVDYTFTLREGLKWVDSQGRRVADVKADDFVAGMQHMMDAMGGLEYLVEGVIVNASRYMRGDCAMDAVGVKAVDDRTLVYTLTGDIPYFMTMLGYSVFAPMSRSYYMSQGGQFGEAFDDSAANYTYGRTPDNIAYCGPYLVTNSTAENTIVFSENPTYWNRENINLSRITWLYNNGQDALKTYTDTMSGVLDGTGLNASSVEKARTDGVFDSLAYVSQGDATTYFAFYNLNREARSNFNDSSVAVSAKSERDHQRSVAAMYNVHFRRALSFAADRASYNAQMVGEDLKYASLRNSFTPGSFVFLPEQTTVTIGDASKTYPAGTAYGQIMQDQLDADNAGIRVWDPNAEAGAGSSDGFDGWYDPQKAAAELELAVAQLEAQGIRITAEDPVYVDFPYFFGSEANTNRANAYKQSVESALGGRVVVNLVGCSDSYDVYYAGYYISMGSEANYDVYDSAGWGPDYGDPQTYLNTLLPDYAGYMTMMLGIY